MLLYILLYFITKLVKSVKKGKSFTSMDLRNIKKEA